MASLASHQGTSSGRAEAPRVPPPLRGLTSPVSRLFLMVRICLRHRRYAQAALWGLGGPLVYVLNRFFFRLDEIVYPNLRKMRIISPVFIIGHPRSGTTFLQRHMAQTGMASMFRTWELWFPALTQRRFFRPVVSLLRQLGMDRLRGRESGHEVRLDAIEEDEAIFLHRLDTETMAFVCPWLLVDDDVADFGFRLGWSNDVATRRTVRFYHEVLKRQLIHTGREHVVAKSTPSVFRLPQLMEEFPDARIVYVYRDPQESILSYLAMHERYMGAALSRAEAVTYFRRKYEWGLSLYRAFEEHRSLIPDDQLLEVRFEDLTQRTEETIRTILEFARIATPGATLVPRVPRRRKKHRNPPFERFGLSRDEIERDLATLRRRYARRSRR